MRKDNIRKTKTDKVDTFIIAKTLIVQDSCRFVSFYDLDLTTKIMNNNDAIADIPLNIAKNPLYNHIHTLLKEYTRLLSNLKLC